MNDERGNFMSHIHNRGYHLTFMNLLSLIRPLKKMENVVDYRLRCDTDNIRW